MFYVERRRFKNGEIVVADNVMLAKTKDEAQKYIESQPEEFSIEYVVKHVNNIWHLNGYTGRLQYLMALASEHNISLGDMFKLAHDSHPDVDFTTFPAKVKALAK